MVATFASLKYRRRKLSTGESVPEIMMQQACVEQISVSGADGSMFLTSSTIPSSDFLYTVR